MKYLYLVLYYGLICKLPNSSFPLGKLFNSLRVILLRRIIKIGRGVKIQRNVYIGNGNDLIIGNNCHINERVRLDNVTIGNNVMIARESIIIGKMHEFNDVKFPMINQGIRQVSKTIIEDDVWIGLRVIVLPGVIIKKGSIIGAGALVTKPTESYCVYGGVPAKKISERNKTIK